MNDKKIGFIQFVKAIVTAIREEEQKPKPEEPEQPVVQPKVHNHVPVTVNEIEEELRRSAEAARRRAAEPTPPDPAPPVEDHSGERKIDLLEKIQTLEQENARLRDQQAILHSENTNLSDENCQLRQERDDLAKRLRDADNYIRSHS